jgi:hypothetical protein
VPAQKIWLVEYLPEAVQDFHGLEAKKERVGVLNVVDKLVALGPSLRPPHMKSLRDEPDLMELRPRQGQSPVRPIYARVGDGYKILAIAATKSAFEAAVASARARATKYGIPLGR